MTGGHAVAVTAKGMRQILPKLLQEPNSHFGKLFADKIGQEWEADVKVSYVLPPGLSLSPL